MYSTAKHVQILQSLVPYSSMKGIIVHKITKSVKLKRFYNVKGTHVNFDNLRKEQVVAEPGSLHFPVLHSFQS